MFVASTALGKIPQNPDGLSNLSPPLCQKNFSMVLLVSVAVDVGLMNGFVEELFSKLFHLREIGFERLDALMKEALTVFWGRCQTTVVKILQFVQV